MTEKNVRGTPVKTGAIEPRRELSPRQQLAAAALAGGQAQRAVCREQRIARETLRAWLAKPEFNAEVDRLIKGARKRILAKLTTTVLPKAAAVIEDTLNERPAGPPSHSEQLRAAELAMRGSGILGHGGGPGSGPQTPQVAVIVVQDDQVLELREIASRLTAAERRWAENGRLGPKPALDDILDAEVLDIEPADVPEEGA